MFPTWSVSRPFWKPEGCKIGRKDFYRSILEGIKEATVRNLSLQWSESYKEVFSEVNIKALWDVEELGNVAQLVVMPHLTQGNWRKPFVLKIILISLDGRSWLNELSFTEPVAEARAEFTRCCWCLSCHHRAQESQLWLSLLERGGTAKQQEGVEFFG